MSTREQVFAQTQAALLAASPPGPLAEAWACLFAQAGVRDDRLCDRMGKALKEALFEGTRRRTAAATSARSRAVVKELIKEQRNGESHPDRLLFVELFSDLFMQLSRPTWDFSSYLESLTGGYIRGAAKFLRSLDLPLERDAIVKAAFWLMDKNGEPV